MRLAFLFHKDPLHAPASIDLIRLRALAAGLRARGVEVAVVAPVRASAWLPGPVPVLPLAVLGEKGRFDVLKACYHFSLELLGDYDGPLVCRLVRVVDEQLPERDASVRARLLACQELARERAAGIVLNNRLNAERWRVRYGRRQRLCLLPAGCPATLPPPGPSPYAPGLPPLLFLGSVASARTALLLNEAAERLSGRAAVHLVGRNKTALYGASCGLSPRIAQHGERPEPEVWDYVRHARLGLELAAGPEPFDNELSKIIAYVRAGLPVLGEERLANAGLFLRRDFGALFRYGDAAHLRTRAEELLARDFEPRRREIMVRAAATHSWERRAIVLERFLRVLTGRVGRFAESEMPAGI